MDRYKLVADSSDVPRGRSGGGILGSNFQTKLKQLEKQQRQYGSSSGQREFGAGFGAKSGGFGGGYRDDDYDSASVLSSVQSNGSYDARYDNLALLLEQDKVNQSTANLSTYTTSTANPSDYYIDTQSNDDSRDTRETRSRSTNLASTKTPRSRSRNSTRPSTLGTVFSSDESAFLKDEDYEEFNISHETEVAPKSRGRGHKEVLLPKKPKNNKRSSSAIPKITKAELQEWQSIRKKFSKLSEFELQDFRALNNVEVEQVLSVMPTLYRGKLRKLHSPELSQNEKKALTKNQRDRDAYEEKARQRTKAGDEGGCCVIL